MKFRIVSPLLFLLALTGPVAGEHSDALCADRLAIERVYYEHRLGNKPPFEQSFSPAQIERLVALDRGKEAVLRKVYGLEITSAMLAVESDRINTSTRAPEILTNLKQALGNNPVRFAEVVAKPIVVERELRRHFENDEPLHAPQRQQAEQVREQILKTRSGRGKEALPETAESRNQKAEIDQRLLPPAGTNGPIETLVAIVKSSPSGSFTETTWQLSPRPPAPAQPDEVEIKKQFGDNAQIISPPVTEPESKADFEDLPPDLQQVLRVQLQQPGDVSAVIEAPSAFLLFLTTDKTDTTLSTASLTILKRSYEQWLAEQTALAQSTPASR